ncbi:LemA family protein [Tessaracoccus sp. OS52]|uniref:LemA family protein n=1 Tax=Tessaracoccus sp. OS52 TaxID=2886691 RepID=UPI001D11923B|nr:LemA family protein [Tessaracoccus sp. OS52]MCC2591907.1 LemA family protein [Tessaracoccus sp. OS52]
MEFLLGLIGVIIVVGLIAVIWGISVYNGFIKGRNLIQESWRQIDVELNRRYELIPNLVETVRGYAAHERNTLEQVTSLRNSAAAMANQAHGAPSEQRAAIESELSSAVRNLIVSVEAYPELKSNVNFLELQRELTDTEDRIAAGRRFYNANVRDYNTRIETVPSNIIAGFANFEKATYFEVNDPQVRQAPDVNFGEISQRPSGQYQQQPQQLPNPGQYQQQPYSAPSADPAAQPQYQQQPYQQQPYQQQPYQEQNPQQPGGYQPPYRNQ